MTSNESSPAVPDQQRATAMHEAAHAVIYIVLGHTVRFVTLSNADGNGMTSTEPSEPDDEIVAIFAGGWAQRLFSDRPPKMWELRPDHEEINRILNIPAVFPAPALILQREKLCVRALELVIANERAIRAVADYLVKHKEIGDAEGRWSPNAGDIIKTILDPAHACGYSLPGDVVIPLVNETPPSEMS